MSLSQPETTSLQPGNDLLNQRFGRFLPGMLGLVVLIAIVALTLLLSKLRTDDLQRAEVDGANLSWVLETRLDATLRRIDSDLMLLVQAVSAQDLQSERARVQAEAMRRTLAVHTEKFDEISGFYFFDAQGELVYASRVVPAFRIDDRAHFKRLRDEPAAGIVFGDVQIARSSGTPSMVAGRAIRDDQGHFLGAVIAVIDLDYFSQLVKSINVGPGGVVAIRRSDDTRLVLRHPPLPAQINQPANYAIRDRIFAGERSGVEHLDSPTDGIPRISTFRALENYPFYIVVAAGKDDVLANWQIQAMTTGGVGALLLGLLAWLGWRLLRGERRAWEVAGRLRESEEQLSYVLEATGDGIWDWRIVPNQVRHNACWSSILGLEHVPEDHPVEYFAALIHPEDRPQVMARVEAALAGDGSYQSEHRMNRIDGRLIWVLDRGRVVERDAQGRPLRMVGSITDITARREAESRQHESEMLMRSAIDVIDEAFVIFDADDKLIYCNEKYRQVYPSVTELIQPGRTFTEIVRTWKERLPEQLQGRDLDDWVARRTAFHRSGGVLIQHTDNDRWMRIVERSTPSGHIVGFRVDITELVHAKEKAEAANLAKSRFLAMMSHEIRTPMNGILGMAQMLQMPNVDEGERLEYARTIYNSGQSMLKLLNDILDLSKVEAGKLQLEMTLIDPNALVEEVRALFAETASGKQVELMTQTRLPDGCLYRGDTHRLRQMLANLVGNALKFTSTGSVRIEVGETALDGEAAMIEFAVSDTGIGIPADKIDLLFQPFSQADDSITREFGGTGLGLSIVRSLVRLMGGDIGVESQPGQGSRFWFRIRVARVCNRRDTGAAEPAGSVPGELAPLPQLRGSVLLVEDNPNNQVVMKALLGKLGVTATLAVDGQEAVNAIIGRGEVPDVILMDLQMPVMDGFEATETLRAWEKEISHRRIPIVALTANAYEEDRRRCLDAQMDGFLAKPVSIVNLRGTLARWLKGA